MIKFRAWDTNNKKMIYEFVMDSQGRIKRTDGIYPKDSFILMQYIKFKDSNDIEIYEGDIVECSRSGDEPYVIVEEIESILKLPACLFGSSLISRLVIGNRYENPELLEVKTWNKI